MSTTSRETRFLVTGGTGTLGSLVVPRLAAAGAGVRVLSRTARDAADGVEYVVGDLAKDEGIEAAVAGTEVVVHLAGTARGDGDKAESLVRAARRAGVRHVVFVSVVGADRVPVESRLDRALFGYFESKLAAERVISGSGLPWTTLRATQFHDLVLKTVRGMAKLPIVAVPAGTRFQPVDTGEVAARVVELALGEPHGLVPDLAGPRTYELSHLVRSYLQAAGKRRPLLPLRLPGRAARAVREGATLAPERAVGRRTWEAFLAEQVGGRPHAAAQTAA